MLPTAVKLSTDIKIARTICHRRVDLAVYTGKAAHADPVGIAERRVNPHRIHRLRIIHHHDQMQRLKAEG